MEAYLYSVKEKLEDNESIQQASTQEMRDEILSLVKQYEEWVHGDDSSSSKKEDYEERLNKLESEMNPIYERATELNARPNLIENVEKTIPKIEKMKTHIETKMDWVPKEKVEEATKKLEDFKAWWEKKSASQEKLADHDVPAYTKNQVEKKMKNVAKAFDKLGKIKKPKPKKEKKPKKKKKVEKVVLERPSLHEKDSDLDSSKFDDIKLLQDRTAEVTENKKKAAAEEDFEEASILKERVDAIDALIKHLEAAEVHKLEIQKEAEAEEKKKAQEDAEKEKSSKTEGDETNTDGEDKKAEAETEKPEAGPEL